MQRRITRNANAEGVSDQPQVCMLFLKFIISLCLSELIKSQSLFSSPENGLLCSTKFYQTVVISVFNLFEQIQCTILHWMHYL
jgi:hypothetical protein